MAQPSHREQLLEGAIECLKTKGFARTTARDIATASNANLASIGYHFGSKEALLNEALIQLFEQRDRRVGQVRRASVDDSPLGFLTATFAAAGGVFKAPRPLFVAFVEAIAQAGHSEDLQSQLATHYQQAREQLADVIRAHVGGERSETMAALLLALFDGLVLQWLLDDAAVPSGKELIEALTETMSIALRRAKPRAGAARG
jgi:AcrR family transcriptional regulator